MDDNEWMDSFWKIFLAAIMLTFMLRLFGTLTPDGSVICDYLSIEGIITKTWIEGRFQDEYYATIESLETGEIIVFHFYDRNLFAVLQPEQHTNLNLTRCLSKTWELSQSGVQNP